MLTLEDIERQLAQQGRTDEVVRAIAFARNSAASLAYRTLSADKGNTAAKTAHSYRTHWAVSKVTGVETYGYPSLVAALDNLPPTEMVGLALHQTSDWNAFFLSDGFDQLIGFVLVRRPSEEERRARQEFFDRHMRGKPEQ